MIRRIGIAAIALAMVVSVVAGGRMDRVEANSQAGERAGKALVKKLPTGLEGVQLSGNRVRIKAGYKFVKQADGSIAVARIKNGSGTSGGTGLGGKWDCSCDAPGKGKCEAVTGGDALYCNQGTCSSSCTLYVTTTGSTVGIVRY